MIDVETYGAAVGAAKRYTDEHSGSDDAVKYTEQDLTTAQQAQARTNIGAASVDSVPTSLAELSDDSTHRLVTDVEKTTWNSTIPSTAKGASNGVAELDSNGKVPSSQLPSFVDDVIEGYYSTLDDRFYEESTFTTLIEPVAGKSWVDIPANKSYRWTGSVYVRVDEGVQIGETADTAYAGNKGKANADAIAAINEVIPSTATSQNPLATEEDIPTDAVKYTAQSLTAAQKSQARQNIGASDGDYRFLTNTPPLVKGSGTGGNLNGGTGMNSTTTTAKKNSIAYGDVASANGNYSAAFGYFLQALHDYEIAYGKFNQSNADTVFSIGDGTDTQNRHNLMELKTDGTLLLNGNAVKTEGGDDNKLRLGQVFDLSNTNPYGIYNYNYGYSLKIVEFSSVEVRNNVSNAKQVGDFVLYRTGTAPSTDKIMFAPIAGRTSGKTLTGAWVKAEYLYELFNNCSALISIDLSPVDTSAVRDMTRMFYKCTSLTTLDLSSFDMSNVIEYTDMFTNDTALTTLKTPKINPHNDITLPRTLYSQDGTAYTTLPVTTGTSIELRQSWT